MTLLKSELKALDVMTADPVCVTPATSLRELAHVFEQNDVSGAPVLDQEGRVVGVVSKTDLIRRCAAGIDDLPPAYLFEVLEEQGADESEVLPETSVRVEDLMTEDPLTVSPETPAAEMAGLMFDRRVHRVIVVDEEKFPLGIVTSLDLLGAFRSGREEEAPAGGAGGNA